MKNHTYKLNHKIWLCQWSTVDDGGYEIFGAYSSDLKARFDSVTKVNGYRCIQPIEQVRDHWVVDTWLEFEEDKTCKKTKLMTSKYLKQLVGKCVPYIDHD